MAERDYRELHRQASLTVDAAGVPKDATFDELHRFMESLRGRQIVIEHLPSMRGVVCGLWISRSDVDADVVCCDKSSRHWKQTVYHEWGHMLLGHGDDDAVALDIASSLVPLIPRDAVKFALARSSFDSRSEAEAEAVGDVLGLLVARAATARRGTIDSGFGSVL